MLHKRMFKVFCPIERNGSTYWMRIGNAHSNKDESINLYLDAAPLNGKLQLRAYTEEELRERAERRASYSARLGPGAPGDGAPVRAAAPGDTRDASLPF